MKLVKTSSSESKKLAEFLKSMPYQGPMDLQQDRGEDFFKLYNHISDDHVTYALVDKNNSIHAVSSLLFREAIIAGERQTVGFATDLRVSPKRRAIAEWAKYFLPAFETERNLRGCKYVFSVVNKYQRQAYNAFIRPRSTRQAKIRYYLFRKFNMVSLHGLTPLAPNPLDTISVRKGKPEEQSEIQNFIAVKQKNRPLYYPALHEDLKEYSKTWQNFDISNFYIARDFEENIIGLVSAYSPGPAQNYKVVHSPQLTNTFRQTVNLLSFVGLTHKLAKPGQQLRFKHLCHIYIDNPDIFYALLREIWKDTAKDEFLLYPQFESDLDSQPPLGFINAQTPFGFYCILAPEDPIPDFIKPVYLGHPADFEGLIF